MDYRFVIQVEIKNAQQNPSLEGGVILLCALAGDENCSSCLSFAYPRGNQRIGEMQPKSGNALIIDFTNRLVNYDYFPDLTLSRRVFCCKRCGHTRLGGTPAPTHKQRH